MCVIVTVHRVLVVVCSLNHVYLLLVLVWIFFLSMCTAV